jgi:hypothetical protein
MYVHCRHGRGLVSRGKRRGRWGGGVGKRAGRVRVRWSRPGGMEREGSEGGGEKRGDYKEKGIVSAAGYLGGGTTGRLEWGLCLRNFQQ